MALIRWNPWNLSSLLEDDLELPTQLSRFGMGQGLNLYETDNEIVAEAALPGVTEDKIDVTVDDGIVRVTGQSSNEAQEETSRRYFMSSRTSSFNYSFRLPEGLLGDKEPSCDLENGVLTLRFEKQQKAPPKKITVNTKGKSK